MDSKSLQLQKNQFASSQDPPIDACTNESCKFVGCTCGAKCGCNRSDMTEQGLTSCDPCKDFKAKQQQAQAAADAAN